MTKAVSNSRVSGPRLICGTALILLVTISGLAIVLWSEDRPLRTIERSLAREDFGEALGLANIYLKSFPSSSEALTQKARALAGLARWSEAARLFDRIGADTASGQRAWSQALMHEERWSEALPLLVRLSGLSPDDSDLLYGLATCQSKLGYIDEALSVAERLSRLKGHELRGRLLLGMLHYWRPNTRLTIQAWLPILERNPELTDLQLTPAEFLLLYGKALLDDGRAAEARPVLTRSVRLAATAEAQNALAETCELLDDLPEAVELWRQVALRDPFNRAAREGLALAALENRSADEALHWLEPLLSRDNLHSSTVFLAKRAATLAGDGEAATRWDEQAEVLRKRERRTALLEQKMRDAPYSYWSRALRAHRFGSEGNAHQALVMAEELLREDPDNEFVGRLADALRNHKTLPSLDLIPAQ